MKRFEIIETYYGSKTYIIEAETLEDAEEEFYDSWDKDHFLMQDNVDTKLEFKEIV